MVQRFIKSYKRRTVRSLAEAIDQTFCQLGKDMDLATEVLEKIRQQYEATPYPRVPLDRSPERDYNPLFIHSLVTSYYLKYQKVVNTTDKLILDAGCGSGWKSLLLAFANPGARIVGVDLSPESTRLAEQRLNHHGFYNCEFHSISILDLPSLGLKFDYINCDETLYLLPGRDPSQGLKVFKSVLKPTGIIRTNLHSAWQRANFFRAQTLFQQMGLSEDTPGELEAEIVIETMQALKDEVDLKARTWKPNYELSDARETIFMNFLLQGDKGFNIPELFAALEAADLAFLSMVEWRKWELEGLFKNIDDLPAVWALSLPELTPEQRLHIFELLNPVQRLLDFWCTHPETPSTILPVTEWSEADWAGVTVHLHPLLRTQTIKEEALIALQQRRAFEISRYITLTASGPILMDSSVLGCLLPLWDGPQSLASLLQRWQKLYPINPVTLDPIEPGAGFALLTETLSVLETFLYILLERA